MTDAETRIRKLGLARHRTITEAICEAVLAERTACAEVALTYKVEEEYTADMEDFEHNRFAERIAKAIEARGKP